MSRALKESLKALKSWVFQSESRIKKIAAGQGAPGTRAAPTQATSNDNKIGSRLDSGEKLTRDGKEFKRYKFQVNKNAENTTLKELANKDSHKVWSQADVPIGEGNPRDVVNQLFQDLEENLKD